MLEDDADNEKNKAGRRDGNARDGGPGWQQDDQ